VLASPKAFLKFSMLAELSIKCAQNVGIATVVNVGKASHELNSTQGRGESGQREDCCGRRRGGRARRRRGRESQAWRARFLLCCPGKEPFPSA